MRAVLWPKQRVRRHGRFGRNVAKFGAATALLFGLTLAPTAASAAPSFDETKLTPSDGAANDEFGFSVAVSGDTIVVGAFADDDNGTFSGSAYVYQPDGTGGYTETKLTASDGAAYDQFGRSVAVSGNTIIVGAPGDDDNGSASGSAYVYQPDDTGDYTETKLTASDGATNDDFGRSVALSGDTIVVGAPIDDDNGTFSGSAYVYQPDGTGGYTETKLTASDGAANDLFGVSVAVSGDTIVVGAVSDEDNGVVSGSAYVYQPDGTGGYTETKLTPSDGATGDGFGRSVAVSGDTIIVGAYLDQDNGSSSGSAYVYQPDGTGGYTETKLTASDGARNGRFGFSVAVSGDTIIVGALGDDDNGPFSGSAYVYAPTSDSDGDGVANVVDACAATVLPDEPTKGLKKNRYIATADGFVSTDGVLAYTLADTAGCSGKQIIEARGLGRGHTKFGISRGALESWIDTVNQ